jgi:hypothetical protein
MKLDLTKSMELLNQAGYPVEDSIITLQTIGKRYNIPPQQIYETIKPALIVSDQDQGDIIVLPESPPLGTSNLTLVDFCTQYDLSNKLMVREFKKRDYGICRLDIETNRISKPNKSDRYLRDH